MEVANESTEIWRYPTNTLNLYLLVFHYLMSIDSLREKEVSEFFNAAIYFERTKSEEPKRSLT